jgi:probable F420-dependent oxidoreductase
MLFALCTFATEHGLLPHELATAAEQRGFESLWFTEHSHIPASRESAWPGGDEMPGYYAQTLDPVVAMTAAAAATTQLRVGTGIALLVERDPIMFAKEIASVDLLSNGRVEVGVGAGWNLEEMRNHGTDPATRFRLLRERVEAVRTIWTNDPAEYHGSMVDFAPIHQFPKPCQKPHPRIHVGGAAPGGVRRALHYGDGWMPIAGRGDDDFGAHLSRLGEIAAELGRESVEGFQVTVYGCPPDPARIEQYENAGVTRVLFFVDPVDRSRAVETLDRRAELVQRLRG